MCNAALSVEVIWATDNGDKCISQPVSFWIQFGHHLTPYLRMFYLPDIPSAEAPFIDNETDEKTRASAYVV